MRIVVLENGEVLRDLNFDSGPLSVGSDAECEVHLPDLHVALQHARMLVVPGGQWVVEAAQPEAQASVNGRDLDKRCPLYNGDEIAIGAFTLKVAVDGQLDLGSTGKTSLDELARIREFPLPRGGDAKQYDEPVPVEGRVHQDVARFAQEVAACADVETLVNRTLSYLLENFDARLAWFGLRRQPRGPLGYMEGRNSDGTPGRDPPLLPTLEYRCLDRGQSIRLRRLEDHASAIAAPLSARRGRCGLLYVESRKSEDRFRGHHLDLLYLLAIHVAARLENLLLGVDPSAPPPEADRLAVVREVQARLDPKSVPPWPGYQVGIFARPGSVQGGDVYDLITMPNGLAACLLGTLHADPMRTAIAMAEVHAAFRVAALHGDPPHTQFRELNWLLHTGRGKCSFSVAHLVMNPKSGAIEYAISGAVCGVILSTASEPRRLAAMPVAESGEAKSGEPPRQGGKLAPGELLALFTRGWGALRDGEGNAVGLQRLIDTLGDGLGLGPADLLEELQGDLRGVFKKGRQPEDVTVMLVHRVA